MQDSKIWWLRHFWSMFMFFCTFELKYFYQNGNFLQAGAVFPKSCLFCVFSDACPIGFSLAIQWKYFCMTLTF